MHARAQSLDRTRGAGPYRVLLGTGIVERCHGIRGFGCAQSSSTRHQTHSAISATRSSKLHLLLFSDKPAHLLPSLVVISERRVPCWTCTTPILRLRRCQDMAIAGPQHAPGTTAPSTMKLDGISSEKEAVNFLIGEVPDVHIARYVHHLSGCPSARKSPYCSPWHSRLQLPGRPTGCQRQRFHPTAKAIFEVKTSGTKRYNHNNEHTNPAESRA